MQQGNVKHRGDLHQQRPAGRRGKRALTARNGMRRSTLAAHASWAGAAGQAGACAHSSKRYLKASDQRHLQACRWRRQHCPRALHKRPAQRSRGTRARPAHLQRPRAALVLQHLEALQAELRDNGQAARRPRLDRLQLQHLRSSTGARDMLCGKARCKRRRVWSPTTALKDTCPCRQRGTYACCEDPMPSRRAQAGSRWGPLEPAGSLAAQLGCAAG